MDDPLKFLPSTPKKRPSYRPVQLRPASSGSSVSNSPINSSPNTISTAATSFKTSLSYSHKDSAAIARTSIPNGTVTKVHWKPDVSATKCAHISCLRTFSFLERKHHCRKCGDIFCAAHTMYEVRLSSSASFMVGGTQVRSCTKCRREFEAYLRTSQLAASSSAASFGVAPSISEDRVPGRMDERRSADVSTFAAAAYGIDGQRSKAIGMRGKSKGDGEDGANSDNRMPMPSVPHDWTWSTF